MASEAAKWRPKEEPKQGISVEDAIAALEEHAKSPRAASALKTLRSDLESGERTRETDGPESPGQKAAKSTPPGQDFDNPKNPRAASLERLAANAGSARA